MEKPDKWSIRFLTLALNIASWSKDPSTQVGAVITDPDRTVVSTGYNGFPRNTNDNPQLYTDRKKKYLRIIHAEKNAMLFAKRDLSKHKLYVTLPPCPQCAAAIIQCGITSVYSISPDEDQLERWGESMIESSQMFYEAGVYQKEYDKTDITKFIINSAVSKLS